MVAYRADSAKTGNITEQKRTLFSQDNAAGGATCLSGVQEGILVVPWKGALGEGGTTSPSIKGKRKSGRSWEKVSYSSGKKEVLKGEREETSLGEGGSVCKEKLQSEQKGRGVLASRIWR